MKILLVEDERPLALAVTRLLTDAGGVVYWAKDGNEGWALAIDEDYDLMILDVLLPGKSGLEIVSAVRAAGKTTPVLMLTAMDELEDKIKGFDAGADDYLAKPFEIQELLARVTSLHRRNSLKTDLVTRIGDFELDRHNRRVKRAGRELGLTRREYDLLEVLASNEGQPVSKQSIQELVWTDDDTFSNSVEVFIHTLRAKVDAPFPETLIHNVGDAYMLSRTGAVV